MLIPFLGTMHWISFLNLSIDGDDWISWFIIMDGEVAGFLNSCNYFATRFFQICGLQGEGSLPDLCNSKGKQIFELQLPFSAIL